MKKDFIVSADELDTLQDKLWDLCQAGGFYMRTYPAANTIEVWSEKELMANIRIVTLDEPYQVINALNR